MMGNVQKSISRMASFLLAFCVICSLCFTGCSVTNKNNETVQKGLEETNTDKNDKTLTEESSRNSQWPEDISLYEVYQNDFLLGSIYTEQSKSGKLYDTLVKNFNVITPENLMKPESMQPRQGSFQYKAADDMLSFASDNHLKVHGHTLAWHQQSGNWLGIGVDRDMAMEQLKNHITTILTKYKGQMISIDVVNEAIDDNAELPENGDWTTCLRKTQWLTSIGTDYIALAFTYAHEADPDIKLYYNDYNLNNVKKAAIVHAMVKDLRSKGVPIDGIGMQGHYNTNTSVGTVEQSLKLFSDLGVEISVSELDVCVNGASARGLTEEQEIEQAVFYAKLFKVYKKYSDIIERVTFWGHVDSFSWRSESCPCLFHADYTPKEAYYAVYDPEAYLSMHSEEGEVEAMELSAMYGTPVIDGEKDAIWEKATTYEVKQPLTAWNGASGTVQIMWDENYLYSYFEVKDSVLNKSSMNLYEQDSVEVFLDQNHHKTDYYEEDDGQYRVNYEGLASFGTVPKTEGFTCQTKLIDGGYAVELAIPLIEKANEGTVYGYEAQINDSNNQGIRQGVMKLSDLTDFSYQATNHFANVTLVKE